MNATKLWKVAALLVAYVGAASARHVRVNGWYPCGFSRYESGNDAFANANAFECAEIEVPMCHRSICESNKTANIFVKRLLAKTKAEHGYDTKEKALWFVQGGPGASSYALEYDMLAHYDLQNGRVSMYTLDHRGTGRSFFLHCDAAQAQEGGSPDGIDITLDELPNCIRDIRFQLDNQTQVYGVTSSASDLKLIIEELHQPHDDEVFVLGYSYGTYYLERLMQLGVNATVRGYILDGVDMATTATDPLESANSHWNKAILTSSRRLLQYCFDDPSCPLRFHGKRDQVMEEILSFYKKLDHEDSSNACAKLLMDHGKADQPSVALRYYLSDMVSDIEKREYVPWILATVKRCSAKDQLQLRRWFPVRHEDDQDELGESEVLDRVAEDNDLLFELIVASERWADPAPTQEELHQFFMDGPFSLKDDREFQLYCIYTQAKDPACDTIADTLPHTEPFAYKRDQYFGKTITLPSTTSLLQLNGGLDFATPMEVGQLFFDKLQGGAARMQVDFDYGSHTTGEATSVNGQSSPCHDALIAQFVQWNGDVERIDTSCMERLPKLHFYTDDEDTENELDQER